MLIYFAKRILSEQGFKSVVQSTAIKMAQLDTDVRYSKMKLGYCLITTIQYQIEYRNRETNSNLNQNGRDHKPYIK